MPRTTLTYDQIRESVDRLPGHSCHAQVAADREAQDVVAVEFTSEALDWLMDALNSAHIIQDNYLHTFSLHPVSPSLAVIDVAVTTFNEV